jgi:cytochrome c biogenesis protein CcmG/thiol:disulfide interchange protein DsbE
MISKKAADQMETAKNLNPPEPKRHFPYLVAGITILVVVGLLVVLGLAMKKAANKSLVLGDNIPDFSLTSYSGETFQKSELTGKVILVNFWSSWCDSCADEGEALEQVWQELKDSGEVVFLGVNYVDTEKEARAFLQKFGVTYANGPDLGSRISHIFKVQAVPETYIIGKEGKLAGIMIGAFNTADEIHSLLDLLLENR